MRTWSIVASLALLVSSSSACEGDKAPAPTAPLAAAPSSVRTPAAASASSAVARPSEHDVAGVAQILVAYQGAEIAPPSITRSRADAQRRAEEAHAKIAQEGMTFAEAAKQYSDDEPSRAVGGKLGNVERGAMQEPFARAVFALPVGGVSAVVETKRGFYVLQRTR